MRSSIYPGTSAPWRNTFLVLCAEQDMFFPFPNTSCFISQIRVVQASSIQLVLHIDSIETELQKVHYKQTKFWLASCHLPSHRERGNAILGMGTQEHFHPRRVKIQPKCRTTFPFLVPRRRRPRNLMNMCLPSLVHIFFDSVIVH